MRNFYKLFFPLLLIVLFLLCAISCASAPNIIPPETVEDQSSSESVEIDETKKIDAIVPTVPQEDKVSMSVDADNAGVNTDGIVPVHEQVDIAVLDENADLEELPVESSSDVFLSEPEFTPTLPEVEMPISSEDLAEEAINNSVSDETLSMLTEPAIVGETAEAFIDEPVEDTASEEVEITGGIWEDRESYPYIAENSELEIPPDTSPSRSVIMPVNDSLSVEYPGTDWFYLGETENTGLLDFTARKLNGENTVFSLNAKKNGKAILHFYKQDLLTNDYIDDYLEVTVQTADANRLRGEVTAPLYTEFVPTKIEPVIAQKNEIADLTMPDDVSESIDDMVQTKVVEPIDAVESYQQTIVQTNESSQVPQTSSQVDMSSANSQTLSNPEGAESTTSRTSSEVAITDTNQNSVDAELEKNSVLLDIDHLSPNELITQAEQAISDLEGKVALSLLDAYFNKAAGNLDHGWFLRGKAYEARTEAQNIRSAVDAYKTLMEQFPASRYWQQAKERMTYLNRFYFNIR